MENKESSRRKNKAPILFGLGISVIYLISLTVISTLVTYSSIEFPGYFGDLLELFGFLCLAILVYLGSESLSSYHIDRYGLLFILIFPGFFNPVQYNERSLLAYIFLILPPTISIILYMHLRKKKNIPDRNTKKLAAYFLLGLAIALIFYIYVIVGGYQSSISDIATIESRSIITQLLYKLSTSSVVEEALFRGFFLGYLVNEKKLSTGLSIVIQAILFSVPHVYQISNPLIIGLSVPFFGLFVGWIAYKTKSITSGIIAHAIYNTLIALV